MRILLIQAISTQDCRELVFPLGIARLSTSLRGRHEVRGLDLNTDPFPWAVLIDTLHEFKPQVIAISFRNLDPLANSLVSFVPQLKTLAALIREHSAESTIILGGAAFTLFPKRLMREIPEAHLGFCGEADTGFPALIDNISSPWKVPGVLWRNGSEIMGDGAIARCEGSLEELPFPDWQLLGLDRYRNTNHYVSFMGVETKRGCPNRCRYCLYPKLQGSRIRLRSSGSVVDEIQTLHQAFQIKLIHFTDPVVNQPAGHLRSICREILKRRLDVGWTGFFREDILTAEDMALYQKAGLVTCYFSGDGTTDWALKLLGKGFDLDVMMRGAQIAAASGVLTVYHFLTNLPDETQRTVDETRALIDRLFAIHAANGNLGAVVFNNLRLYPGADLTETIIRRNLIDPRQDLLYPTYFNPPPWDFLRHELSACCMKQSTLRYLENQRTSAT
jgi:putative variant cofactor biosynthesis B12-binding/radical SAM domain protein 1